MTGVRRLMRIDVGGWLLVGVWLWFLPLVFLWVWTGSQTRLGWSRATWEVGAVLALLILARVLGLALYHRWVAGRWPLTLVFQDGGLKYVPTPQNLPFLLAVTIPLGLGLGVLANLFGWSTVIPERWLLMPTLGPVVAGLFSLGSVVIYNRVAGPWLGSIQMTVEERHGWVRAVVFSSSQVRRTAHLVGFIWVVLVTLVLAGLGGTLLTVLAGHIPAGTFGVEAGLFSVAIVLFVGFWASGALSLWYGIGARVYRSWVSQGGGIFWQEAEVHEAS